MFAGLEETYPWLGGHVAALVLAAVDYFDRVAICPGAGEKEEQEEAGQGCWFGLVHSE